MSPSQKILLYSLHGLFLWPRAHCMQQMDMYVRTLEAAREAPTDYRARRLSFFICSLEFLLEHMLDSAQDDGYADSPCTGWSTAEIICQGGRCASSRRTGSKPYAWPKRGQKRGCLILPKMAVPVPSHSSMLGLAV